MKNLVSEEDGILVALVFHVKFHQVFQLHNEPLFGHFLGPTRGGRGLLRGDGAAVCHLVGGETHLKFE
jgi:hypothetical protein